jgi:hypothetical protein
MIEAHDFPFLISASFATVAGVAFFGFKAKEQATKAKMTMSVNFIIIKNSKTSKTSS